MPIYFISPESDIFPHPLACDDEEGLLAISEELTIDQLILAYHFGVFPWYLPGDFVQWFFPNPRSVIFPEEIKISKSMRPYFNQQKYTWTLNKDFDAVIRQCQTANGRQEEGTWIGDEIIRCYTTLHEKKIAHSIEVWKEEVLVGGLYGVWIGRVFYGESMFSLEKNASKFGFISFIQHFSRLDRLSLVDCQIQNQHLTSLGARNIPRSEFLQLIKRWAWSSQ